MGRNSKKRAKLLKVKIRECKMTLENRNLSADVRQTRERILKALTMDLSGDCMAEPSKRASLNSKASKRYKKIRFFERRKLIRKLKQVRRNLKKISKGDLSDRDVLESSLLDIRKRINYTIYFPEDQKYLSLFPNSQSTDMKACKRRTELIDSIWEQVLSGELKDGTEGELEKSESSEIGKNSESEDGDGSGTDTEEMDEEYQQTDNLSKDDFFI